jgi:hypothetical protein
LVTSSASMIGVPAIDPIPPNWRAYPSSQHKQFLCL